jgi:hypothetical protein
MAEAYCYVWVIGSECLLRDRQSPGHEVLATEEFASRLINYVVLAKLQSVFPAY